MPQVSEKVLAWLYNVLQTYFDRQRAYSDAAYVLQAYPSLNPRTEVYTYDSGASALLLTLSGTLPVNFRGTLYHFPIKLWIPQSYPQEPPIAYVSSDRDLQIRAGQHVSIDGRIYHPYLREWTSIWDRASIAELLEYLQQAFAKEPPVVGRAAQQHQRGVEQLAGPSVRNAGPSLPPKHYSPANGTNGTSSTEGPSPTQAPPPRPPKPGDPQVQARDTTRDGPPLPPLPGERLQRSDSRSIPTPPLQQTRPLSHAPGTMPSHANQSHPYRPHDDPQSRRWSQAHTPEGHRLGSPAHMFSNDATPIQARWASALYDAAGQQQAQQYRHHIQPQAIPQQHPSQPHAHSQRMSGHPASIVQPAQHQTLPAVRTSQKQPVKDLLSDPFDIALPASTAALPAPPIPPNPEREHLLHALATTLSQQAQQKVNQNGSAIAPLQAQQHALRAARARLEAELAQLEALDASLASNEAILHRSIQDCDRAIATAKSKTQPPIDDVLVAPTLVAQQLWTASADEAACRQAMYALQNAVDKGRISGVDFVRQMRGLGRECFLKMALARKCAEGLGLDIERR